jgi:tagaturonate reductase
VLAPVLAPGMVRLLLGTSISLNTTGMMISLVYIVVIPTIIGVSLNESSRGKIPALISPWLSPLSKFCPILIIAANSAAVAPQIRLDNPRLWLILAVCIGFSVLGFMCGKLMGLVGKFSREKQITVLYASGLRNIGAALILAIEFFPASAALPALLGILFQQTNAAVMGRVFFRKSQK